MCLSLATERGTYTECIYMYICTINNTKYQASTYEASDCTCMPLHTPKSFGTCKISTTCLITKASRCAADHTSKTTMFFFFQRSYDKLSKILQQNHVYLLISLIQWWKLYYIYIFFTQRTTDFNRLKRNMNGGTTVFLTTFLIALAWNILLLFCFWCNIISCFK